MIQSLLIANRGEIAVRIIRTCREMGISPVAVYSEADADALHVRLADKAVCIGPPDARRSYLNVSNLISAALITECDAIHPGVGFLAENADFARKVTDSGIFWIGPSAETIAFLGDKVQAKRKAREAGIPVIPGTEGSVDDFESAAGAAQEMGYPVIIKAAAGGGGKGMRIVRTSEELQNSLKVAANEAQTAFSDGTLYIEKYLENPRHVEIQLLSDSSTVLTLGERDCSVQQKHQKLIEESPSPGVDRELRERMSRDAVGLFENLGYAGAGTIEFLVHDDRYYFMEVNARVQVEHPVSELVTGVDIIRQQILSCIGRPLEYRQADVPLVGWAMECRINAAAPGKIVEYLQPGGFSIRCDGFLYAGYTVPSYYDALVAKVIAHGRDRNECIERLLRGLGEMRIAGVPTNIETQKRIIDSREFRGGNFGTSLLEELIQE
jgi:acetyl-CoA carboxylase, biotin carboxylase subunit